MGVRGAEDRTRGTPRAARVVGKAGRRANKQVRASYERMCVVRKESVGEKDGGRCSDVGVGGLGGARRRRALRHLLAVRPHQRVGQVGCPRRRRSLDICGRFEEGRRGRQGQVQSVCPRLPDNRERRREGGDEVQPELVQCERCSGGKERIEQPRESSGVCGGDGRCAGRIYAGHAARRQLLDERPPRSPRGRAGP